MAAATGISKKAEFFMAGGKFEIWEFTLDPGSIAAAAQDVSTVAIPNAEVGDKVLAINVEVPEAALIVQGGKITSAGVLSVYLTNNLPVTTALDSGALVYQVTLFKVSATAAK
jgi:hypothetical protein